MAVALDQNIFVLSQYGPTQPSILAGPVLQGLGKYGDGVGIYEGTTNLVTNPSFEVDTTGYAATPGGTATATGARSASGSRSALVTMVTTGTGGAGLGYAITAGVLANSTTYTFSAWAYVPSGSVTGCFLSVQGAIVATNQSSTGSTALNQWVRLSVTFTTTASAATSTGTIYVLNSSAATAGQVFYTDAWQLEQKAYATPYAEGSLATAWNAPGNLLPTAAQSLEDGTTASAITSGTATLSNSGTQFYAGTRSLLATVTSTTSLTVRTGAAGTGAAPVAAGKTYTASTWLRPSAGRQLRAELNFYDAAGGSLAGAAGAYSTAAANAWNRYFVSAVAPASAAFASIQWNSTDATNGDLIYTDAQRIDEGTASAAYRWAGAENASTSTRTAAALQQAVSGVSTAISVAVLVRPAVITAGTQIAVTVGADGNNKYLIYISGANINFQKIVGGVGVTPSVGLSPAAGDLLFLALTFDGTTLTGYGSKNGGAILSSASASSTVPPAPTVVTIGDNGGGGWVDGLVEQVLVYNRALTSTEVAALATQTNETNYSSDPGIVLAAGTGVARGTVTAETATGTGYYRADRSLKGYVETITPNGASPDDDGATMKITLPAGSGVGAGSTIAIGYPTSSYSYTVKRVSSPLGVYDEVYV